MFNLFFFFQIKKKVNLRIYQKIEHVLEATRKNPDVFLIPSWQQLLTLERLTRGTLFHPEQISKMTHSKSKLTNGVKVCQHTKLQQVLCLTKIKHLLRLDMKQKKNSESYLTITSITIIIFSRDSKCNFIMKVVIKNKRY